MAAGRTGLECMISAHATPQLLTSCPTNVGQSSAQLAITLGRTVHETQKRGGENMRCTYTASRVREATRRSRLGSPPHLSQVKCSLWVWKLCAVAPICWHVEEANPPASVSSHRRKTAQT